MPHCWRMTRYGTGIDLVISGSEVAEDRPDDWVLEAWYPESRARREARRRQPVCRQGSKIRIEKLPDADWLVLSQQEVEPIRAGRFLVEPRIPAFTRGGKFCNSLKPSNT